MKKGLARTTFLYSFLLVTLVLMLSITVLYIFVPGYYLYAKRTALERGMDKLAEDLRAASGAEECAVLLSEFSAGNNANVACFDPQGRMIPVLSSPFVSMNEGGNFMYVISGRTYAVPSGNGDEISISIRVSEPLERRGLPAPSTHVAQEEWLGVYRMSEPGVERGDTGAGSYVSTERDVGAELVGRVVLSSPLQPIDEAKDVILSFIPYLLAGCLAVGLILAYLFSRKLTEPILRISGAAVRMRRMEPDAISGVRSGDELGELSRNLDSLYESLRENIGSLRAEMERAGRLERSKAEFMRSASHELKTPIAALSGVLEGMIDNVGVYRNRDEYLPECKQLVDRMSELVGEILRASKADLPNEELEYECVDISELVQEALAGQELLIREKGLRVETDGLEYSVRAEEALLRQAVSNLISNAARYTVPGGRIRVAGVVAGDGSVRLEVENESERIPEEELQKLTEPFYTRSYSRDHADSGTGLGLYIARKNLERLGLSLEIYGTDLGVMAAVSIPEERTR